MKKRILMTLVLGFLLLLPSSAPPQPDKAFDGYRGCGKNPVPVECSKGVLCKTVWGVTKTLRDYSMMNADCRSKYRI